MQTVYPIYLSSGVLVYLVLRAVQDRDSSPSLATIFVKGIGYLPEHLPQIRKNLPEHFQGSLSNNFTNAPICSHDDLNQHGHTLFVFLAT